MRKKRRFFSRNLILSIRNYFCVRFLFISLMIFWLENPKKNEEINRRYFDLSKINKNSRSTGNIRLNIIWMNRLTNQHWSLKNIRCEMQMFDEATVQPQIRVIEMKWCGSLRIDAIFALAVVRSKTIDRLWENVCAL